MRQSQQAPTANSRSLRAQNWRSGYAKATGGAVPNRHRYGATGQVPAILPPAAAKLPGLSGRPRPNRAAERQHRITRFHVVDAAPNGISADRHEEEPQASTRQAQRTPANQDIAMEIGETP